MESKRPSVEKPSNEKSYTLPGFDSPLSANSFILTEESKRLFANKLGKQGFVGVAWKGKREGSEEDVIYIELIPGFNQFTTVDKGYSRSNKEGEYLLYDSTCKTKQYTPEEYKQMAVYTPQYSNLIHVLAIEVLKKSGRMPEELTESQMFGFGIYAGDTELLEEFRVNSFNINAKSVQYDREYLLTQYYAPPEVDLNQLSIEDIHEKNHSFKLKRPLPIDISKYIFDQLMNGLPSPSSTTKRTCKLNNGLVTRETQSSELWWEQHKNNPLKKNEMLLRTLFTCLRMGKNEKSSYLSKKSKSKGCVFPDEKQASAEKEARDKLTKEIIEYIKINQQEARKYFTIPNILDSHFTNVVDASNGDSCLTLAVKKGYIEVVRALLDAGVNYKPTNYMMKDAFVLAVENNNGAIFELLLNEHEKRDNILIKDSLKLMLHYNPWFISKIVEMGFNEILHVVMKHIDINANELAFVAAQHGKVEILALLISKGINLNTPNANGKTLAAIAAEHGHINILEWLSQNGVDLNQSNANGENLTFTAAKNGRIEVLKFLDQCDVNWQQSDVNGKSLAYTAIKYKRLDVLEWLHEQKFDFNAEANSLLHIVIENSDFQGLRDLISYNIDVSKVLETDQTFFMDAVKGGNSEMVKLLIEHKANIDHVNEENETAIFSAVEYGHTDIIRVLAEQKAKVCIPYRGKTPLFAAVEKRNAIAVGILLAHKADINTSCGEYTPLSYALDQHDSLMFKCLVENNANLNTPYQGKMPLYRMAENKNIDGVKLLLKHKARFDIEFEDKPLIWVAIENDDVPLLKELIIAKADVNTPYQGQLPIFSAANNNLTDIMMCLMENNANFNVSNQEGKTPAIIAAERGNCAIIRSMASKFLPKEKIMLAFVAARHGKANVLKVLIDAKLDLNVRNKDGQTLAYVAAEHGHANVINMLKRHNVDLNVPNKEGKTPAFIAHHNQHTSVTQCLASHEADLYHQNKRRAMRVGFLGFMVGAALGVGTVLTGGLLGFATISVIPLVTAGIGTAIFGGAISGIASFYKRHEVKIWGAALGAALVVGALALTVFTGGSALGVLATIGAFFGAHKGIAVAVGFCVFMSTSTVVGAGIGKMIHWIKQKNQSSQHKYDKPVVGANDAKFDDNQIIEHSDNTINKQLPKVANVSGSRPESDESYNYEIYHRRNSHDSTKVSEDKLDRRKTL